MHRLSKLLLVSILIFALADSTKAQGTLSDEHTEIFLSFRYQGGVNTTIIGYFDNGQYYLPVIELFRELLINVNYDRSTQVLSGFFIDQSRRYEFSLRDFNARYRQTPIPFTADDAFIDDYDIYFNLEYLREVFNLNFEVDFSNLVLRLVATEKLPVVIRYERERARRNLASISGPRVAEYPLYFDRNRSFFSPGYLDYNLNNQYIRGSNYSPSLNLTFGTELLMGDVQGNFNVQHRDNQFSTLFQSTRYRYTFLNSNVFKQFYAGQITGESPNFNSLRGIRITNNPLIPERTFEQFTLDDSTIPESEVELFINNRLVDFTKADESGRYTFPVSLTYGINDIRTVIYGPNGEMIESSRRFEIPFNFVPLGQFRYDAGAGLVRSADFTRQDDDMVFYGVARYSPFRFMTNSLAFEHIVLPDDQRTIITTSTSLRLLSNVLANIDYSPGYYIRGDGYYQSQGGTYIRANAGFFEKNDFLQRNRANHSYGFNAYHPIRIGETTMALRGGLDVTDFDLFTIYRSSLDLNFRYKRLNTRFGVRDNLRTFSQNESSHDRRIISSLAFSTPRAASVPTLLQGLYTRAQVEFIGDFESLGRIDVSISRSLLRQARLQTSWQYDAPRQLHTFFFTLSYDFNRVRSTTSARFNRNTFNITQSMRGSVSYDQVNNTFWFENRAQVGRSSISPILFIDNNGSGKYDRGDTRVHGNAVRVLGAGARVNQRDDMTVIHQLLPYHRYDVEVNKGAIRDPFLVPAIERFSIITDPNQHKRIEIPLVRTGIVEGDVIRVRSDGTRQGVGGLRISLRGLNNNFETTIRTFVDGYFYIFEIPPGDYEMIVDPEQLEFMGLIAEPSVRRFTIRSLEDGDVIEDAGFILRRPAQ